MSRHRNSPRRRKTGRQTLRGFRDLMPYSEPKRITGLTPAKKKWACTVLGYDIYVVDGPFIRKQWADFIGGHDLAYAFIPNGEIWLDSTFKTKEWIGYIGAHEMLEVLLMRLLDRTYNAAHNAANNLEQHLRSHPGLSQASLFDIVRAHMLRYFPSDDETTDAAASIARQFWKYL